MRTQLDLSYDLIAVESEDTVHALLELTAPTPDRATERPPATLQLVIDRSGSMADGRLYAALQALDALIGRLRPDDRLGFVTFDDEVEVPIAAAAIGDGARARQALPGVHPGGMTNLSGGLLRGIQEAQRGGQGDGATLVLLSDGHANCGVTDHSQLERFAAGAQRERITTSTIGVGLGYDEDLLAAISRGGGGNASFAEHGDDAGAALAAEVDGLLATAAQAASLTVRPSEEVLAVRLFNDLPATAIEGGFMAELGDLHAGERRRILLEIDVPALAGLGLRRVCELELRWVDVASLKSRVATIPVQVNVVPGDEAAARTENPQVRTELAFQDAQRVKREATDALRDGNVAKASSLYRDASNELRVARASAPAESAPELASEAELLDELAERADVDAANVRKRANADYHMKARRRGREPREPRS
jgi:Ca-activated chloride channel family protein